MAKQITFTYEDTDYTLEYTKRSVQQMERNGFDVNEFASKPMTLLPQLFAGAFLAHHRFVKQDRIDEIFSQLPDKEGLVEKLVEMYNEPIEAMLGEPTKGNVKWTASW